jgi:hypothetical protein
MTAPTPKHPARFSDPIMPVLAKFVEPGWTVVDRFAGTGRVHELRDLVPGVHTFAVEIEFEWAAMHPSTWCGDAFEMTGENRYDAEVTSVTYGNRFADSHNAQERCRACKGTGWIPIASGAPAEPCEKCEGTGTRNHHRRSYTHNLGRPLTRGSSGSMHWGQDYRAFHTKWLESSFTLVRRRLVLNVSDHIRDKKRQPVVRWFRNTAREVGFTLVAERSIETKRLRDGANRESRVKYEKVLVFDKEATDG